MKFISKLYFALVLFLPSFLFAVENSPNSPDIVSYTQYRNGVSTGMFRIDRDGNIIPGRHGSSDIGESSHTYKAIWVDFIDVSSGLVNSVEEWTSIPAPSTFSLSGFRGFSITSATLNNQGTTYATTDITQSTVPRNITMSVDFPGVDPATIALALGATVYGYNAQGLFTSELIRFSTSSQEAIGTGNIAWAHISSVTVRITSASQGVPITVFLHMGVTNQIGLLNPVEDSSDVYKVTEGDLAGRPFSLTTVSPTINTTFDTINFSIDPALGAAINRKRVWTRSKRNRQLIPSSPAIP